MVLGLLLDPQPARRNSVVRGRTPRGDGLRFIVQSDELLTAFLELEKVARAIVAPNG